VQHFTIPPHIYSPAEMRAVTLLKAVANTYQSAHAIAYTATQVTTLPVGVPAAERPAPLTWTISLRRPNDLHVTAAQGGTVGLEITSEKDALLVHHQMGKDETRPVRKTITIDDVPELAEDPVARMIFGNSLLDNRVEQIRMTTGKGNQRDEVTIVLSLLGEHALATLVIDRRKHLVLSCTTAVTEEQQVTTVTLSYSGDKVIG
jgi:hypothetical protein